jgi:RimJ/RimL family protein N-acetyltransferase
MPVWQAQLRPLVSARGGAGVDIVLKLLDVGDWHLVAAIELDREQEDFAGGSLEKIFRSLQLSEHPDDRRPFAVIVNGRTAGFFVLREGPALPEWACENAMTLHSFRVSKSLQGRGYGTAALVLAARWIRANRPNIRHLMLTVNAENPQASSLYLRCGFRTTGVIFQGRIGRERVLACDIDALARRSERPE